MTLSRLVVIAVLVGVMAVFMIYEHSRLMRGGYEVSRLSHDEAGLVEQLRLLDVQVTKLRQPEFIERQVRRMRIDLMRRQEAEIVPISTFPPEVPQ
jgi:hypothetical protein